MRWGESAVIMKWREESPLFIKVGESEKIATEHFTDGG